MKKFLFGLIVFLSFLIYHPTILAATAIEAQQWHCLNTEYTTANGQGHTVKLTTKADDPVPPNSKTYIFDCLATELGNVCTTGNSALDQQTVGYDGLTRLKQSTATGGYQQLGFSFNGQPVPKDKIVSNDQGKLTAPMGAGGTNQLVEPIQWTDASPKGVGRRFLALNFVNATSTAPGAGGQQQGTFTFEGAAAHCIAISWDPYGIVFDSQSLEPIPGVKVSLFQKGTTGTYSLATGQEFASLLNPVYTDDGGAFSFFVPDGTYKLDAAAANFTFPSVPTKLNNNYSQIYSDIYHGEDIVQQGAIQHRDIPLDSKTVPYTAPVKLIAYFSMLDKTANAFIIQGRVSHPLTRINVYGKKPSATDPSGFVRTRLLATFQANKQGQFEIKIDMSKLEPTEMVGDIELIKPNYNQLTAVDTTTKPTVFSVEPIPNYLQGYAYSAGGQIMPNATVGVYLNSSSKPAYEVQTDDKGYFVISSEYLPDMAYNVKYTPASGGAPITVAPSKFIAENADYITAQHENLYGYKDKNGAVHNPASQVPPAVAGNPVVSPTASVAGMAAGNAGLLAAALSFLIIIVAIIIVVYFLKKRQTAPPPMPPIPPTSPPVV